MDRLIEYFGINRRMCVGKSCKKEKGTRLKWHKRVKIGLELKVLQKGYMKLGVQMLVKHIDVISGCIGALWMRPSERLEVRRNIARDGQEGWRVSQHRFSDARNGVSKRNGGDKRNEDMTRVWRRQVFEATRSSKVRGPAGVVFRELSDVGVMCRQWCTFMVDGSPIDAVSKHMSRHMRKLCWKSWVREHDADEMNDDSWFQPVKRIIKNKWTTIWTRK